MATQLASLADSFILFTPFFGIFLPTVKAGPRLALNLGISLGGYREKSIE